MTYSGFSSDIFANVISFCKCVLISYSYKKLPQTWWLKITKIYCLKFWRLEVSRRRHKFKVSTGPQTSKSSGENLPPFFQLWVAVGILWLSIFAMCLLFLMCLFSSIRTLVIGLRAHSHHPEWVHLEIFNINTSINILFLNRITCTVSGHSDMDISLCGHHSIQYTLYSNLNSLVDNWLSPFFVHRGLQYPFKTQWKSGTNFPEFVLHSHGEKCRWSLLMKAARDGGDSEARAG